MTTSSIGDTKEGPFILNCNYCMWTTLDVGITFEKSTNIRAQLDKIANGGKPKPPSKPTETADPSRKSSLARAPFSPSAASEELNPLDSAAPPTSMDSHAHFNSLKSFYRDQLELSASTDSSLPTSSLDLAASYSSPATLARIMSLYTNLGTASTAFLKKSRHKAQPMREALDASEGLSVSDPNQVTQPVTNQSSTTSISQRQNQFAPALGNPHARHVSELRPLPTLLRTKRAKRCLACKHILTKPELKPSSTRYRIRLLALNYIPLVSLKPVPVPGGLQPLPIDGGDVALEPGKPSQWVLTMKNPLFEKVKVSLGCPATLPGRRGDRVTILCPQFEIGANSDVWDDALNAAAAKAFVSPGGEQIAGRIYESGKNWVGVVLEIVPGNVLRREGEGLEQDEDLVELPIRVRLEWRVSEEERGKGQKEKRKTSVLLEDEEGGEGGDIEDDGKRELAYWMVVGIGRVAC